MRSAERRFASFCLGFGSCTQYRESGDIPSCEFVVDKYATNWLESVLRY